MYNYTQMLILHDMFCAVANECIDVEGVMHKNGEAYMGPDKCNTCKCMNGKSACTKWVSSAKSLKIGVKTTPLSLSFETYRHAQRESGLNLK